MMAAALCIGCGSGSLTPVDPGDGAPDGGLEGLPTSLAALQRFVRAGAYAGWSAEPRPHQSAGPHGGLVRTFVNPLLRESLAAHATAHPPGSIVVKELFSGDQIRGYAIDVKRADGEWVFLEGFLPSLDQYFFTGTSNLCGNCHRAGVDFVLTPSGSFE